MSLLEKLEKLDNKNNFASLNLLYCTYSGWAVNKDYLRLQEVNQLVGDDIIYKKFLLLGIVGIPLAINGLLAIYCGTKTISLLFGGKDQKL